MPGLYVRDKYIYEQMRNEKFGGMGQQIMGQPLFVLPGASATHNAFMRNHHQNVFNDINTAYAAAVSGRGDAIVLFSGTHTCTASIAATKDEVSIYGWEAWMGAPVRRSSSTLVGPTGDEAFNITGDNMRFVGVSCVPVTAKSFADFTTGTNGLVVRNCFIDLFTPVVNIATAGFVGLVGCENVLFEDTLAWSDGAQGPALSLTGNNKFAMIKNNRFHNDAGTWASAVNLIDPDGITAERNLATCGGTAMTACFTGSGTTVIAGVVFADNRCGVLVTKMVDGFATTSHAEMVENRTATIGGGAGSTLVVDVT